MFKSFGLFSEWHTAVLTRASSWLDITTATDWPYSRTGGLVHPTPGRVAGSPLHPRTTWCLTVRLEINRGSKTLIRPNNSSLESLKITARHR